MLRKDLPKPLSKKVQEELFESYQNGNEAAGERLISTNMAFVHNIANQFFSWSKVDLEDLIAAGYLGLCMSLPKYDPTKGASFTTYASLWIESEIKKFINTTKSQFRLDKGSRDHRRVLANLRKTQKKIRQKNKEATPEAIAKEMGAPINIVRETMLHISPVKTSIYDTVSNDSSVEGMPSTLISLVASETKDPIDIIYGKQKVDELNRFGRSLPDNRSKIIWYDRIISPNPKSLDLIGEALNISGERVRQLEVRIRKQFNEWSSVLSFVL